MPLDVTELEKTARKIRARFLASIIRLALGFTAGALSLLVVVSLGPSTGCGSSLLVGVLVYAASIPLLRRLLGDYLERRQYYTTGIISFLAAWLVGFVFFSQLVFNPPS